MEVKPEIKSVEVHPQQGSNGHPVDDDGPGGWVAGSLLTVAKNKDKLAGVYIGAK